MSNPYGYCFGVMIEYVLDYLEIRTNRSKAKSILYKSLKEYFDVDSTSGLSEKDMWVFISKCLMILSREYGIYPPSPRMKDESDELKFK